MNAAILFFSIFALLNILRHYFLRKLKSDVAFLTSAKENLYKMNQKLVYTEMYFIFFLFIGGITSAFMMEGWEEDHELLSTILTIVFICIIIISGLFSSIILQRQRSFLYWGSEYIEFNFSFGSLSKKTVKIYLNNINEIISCSQKFIIKKSDGEDVIIRRKLITLLNNHQILMSKLGNFMPTSP